MNREELKKLAIDAAMERVVGSSSVPAKYLAKVIQEYQKAAETVKRADSAIAKYESALERYSREVTRLERLQKGEKGEDGRPGRDGVDGKDAKEVDVEALVARVTAKIRQPKDGKDAEVDYEKAAREAIRIIFAEKLLKKEHVNGLDAEIASYRAQLAGKHYGKDTWARGSGTTVSAGENITLVPQADGTVRINASGGGSGTNVTTQYSLTAVQAGDDVTIDLTQLTNYADFVNLIALYRNNIMQTETLQFTIAGDTVTVLNAAADEIFNITYSYS